MTSIDHLRTTGDEILRLHALIEGSGALPESARVAQESRARALMMQLACDCVESIERPERHMEREIITVMGFSDLAEWRGITVHKKLQYLARAYAGGVVLAQIVTQRDQAATTDDSG